MNIVLRRGILLFGLSVMLGDHRATAQSAMAGHDMGAMVAVPAPESLPAPEHLTGIGNSHLTITATPEAQAWFTQGLNLYHDFWDYESERAFEQAVRVDPTCAMCYWGLYKAERFRGGPNTYSAQALEQAKHLKGHATKVEQAYIKAAGLDGKKEIEAYRKLVKMAPDDIQAKLLLAGSLHDGYTDAGEPKPGTKEAIAVLEQVLAAHPDDSAANHYWIHAMEPSSHPERAIDSAKKLAEEAPASGHMVHMPGHIFYRTGDYADAESWFARSTAVDEAYMQTQHVDFDDDWNYVHNLQYAIADLMEEGKWKEAIALSGKLTNARGQYAATLYTFSPRDNMARLNNDLPVMMRQGAWQWVIYILAGVTPEAKLPNLEFFAGQLRTYADGMYKTEQGDLPAAEADAKSLDGQLEQQKTKAAAQMSPQKKSEKKPSTPVMQAVLPDASMGSMVENLSVMAQELHASILAAKKDYAGAKPLFDKAAEAEKKLGYREPPEFIQPVSETEGVELLRDGDAKDAHAAFAAALADRPNSGLSLYGEAQSSEAAGNASGALDEYAKFLAAWKDSDPGSEQVKHAQQFVAAHPVVAQLAR